MDKEMDGIWFSIYTIILMCALLVVLYITMSDSGNLNIGKFDLHPGMTNE